MYVQCAVGAIRFSGQNAIAHTLGTPGEPVCIYDLQCFYVIVPQARATSSEFFERIYDSCIPVRTYLNIATHWRFINNAID